MSRLSSETLRPDEAATDKQGTAQRPSPSSRESGRTKQSMAGQPCCNVRRGFPRVQVQTTQPRTSRVPQRPSLSPRDFRASRVLYKKPVHAVTNAASYGCGGTLYWNVRHLFRESPSRQNCHTKPSTVLPASIGRSHGCYGTNMHTDSANNGKLDVGAASKDGHKARDRGVPSLKLRVRSEIHYTCVASSAPTA
jgi:hypothetical protein